MAAAPLIPADATFLLLAAVLGLVAFGFWAEQSRVGKTLSGALIVLMGSFALSNLGVLPKSAPLYDMVWDYFVPAAIPLFLFKAHLRKIVTESGPTLIAFVFAALGALGGAVVGFMLLPLGERAAELTGIFSATYIGGSMNFAAVSRALEFEQGSLLSAAIAADNVAGTLYLGVLVALPAIGWCLRAFPGGVLDAPEGEDDAMGDGPTHLDLGALSGALALSFGLCAAGFGLAALIAVPSLGILFITALALAVATLFPQRMARLKGDYEAGMILMYIFFAAIGAGADLALLVETAPILFFFAVIILVCQLAMVMIAGKLFKVGLAEMVIGANAAALGPTTAAALAAARGWRPLVTPGILVGTLGYATANFIGVMLAGVLQ